MQETQWFVVANAARARVYSRTGDDPLRLVCSLEHLASRATSAQLGKDKAGREPSGRGFGGATFEPRLEPHRREHLRFAQEIAQFLEHEAQGGTFAKVSLIAGSPFLGELRQQLGKATTRLLDSVCDLDLSAVGPAELDRRVRQAVAQ
jgi:protein required for attachment to host cells